MPKQFEKVLGTDKKVDASATPAVTRSPGAVDGFTMTMTWENGFLFDSTRQFKFLCPVQMDNGDRVRIVATLIPEGTA